MNIKIYGADWCPDCVNAKNFLKSKGVEFEYIIITDNKEATSFVEKINDGKRVIPTLVIDGKARQGNGEVSYLHQGIASRAFERNFDLADYVKVTGANIENGMLTVDLERELPEALKPHKIAIKNGPANGLVDKAKKLLGADEQVAA
jgi:glutaredoxin